jgi:hypothetical protein
MQKSEDAAILMQVDFNDITTLFPSELSLSVVKQLSAMEPFTEEAIGFFDQLSKILNKNPRTRAYTDVATFAFFCRKSNLLKIKEQYNDQLRLGRGIVFHIAPSNVPVNFAYSLLCGVLAGNINIVRVSSKEFEQVTIICEAIAAIQQTGNYDEITKRIFIVRYDRQNKATDLFSSLCDVRVIWGGDDTIAQIRQSPIPARSFDVTFADRYSLCIINADRYCNEPHPESVANGFYNDTFLFDQNACTAPHLIIWKGTTENVEKSKKVFWETLYQLVKKKYKEIQEVIAVDKLTAFYNEAIHLPHVRKVPSSDNLLWRIDVEKLPLNIDEYRSSCGYFTEYTLQSLTELKEVINRKYQTLAYYGFPADIFANFIREIRPVGIDRIVPIGHTMDFSVIWDGFDLIETLSRNITIPFSHA